MNRKDILTSILKQALYIPGKPGEAPSGMPNLPQAIGDTYDNTVDSLLQQLKDIREANNVSSTEMKNLFSDAREALPDVSVSEIKNLFSDALPDASLSEIKNLFGPSKSSPKDMVFRQGDIVEKGDRDSGSNKMVRDIQSRLEEHGYKLHQYGVDGAFGEETENAVMEFQENNKSKGLTPTGKVDFKTFMVLNDSSAEKRKPNSKLSKGDINVSAVNSGKVSEGQLFSDLSANISNKELCVAMVANAIGESALYPNINGDCGRYAKKKGSKAVDTSLYPNVFKKPKRGGCCSFGLWQYNICGGLGNALLKYYGVQPGPGSTDEEKIPILTSYEKQVEFMIHHVNRVAPMSKKKSVDWWVRWFVYRVERPADMAGATKRRQQIVRSRNLLRFLDEGGEVEKNT